MKFHSHLNTAIALLKAYDGKIPFSAYIKNHFRENKKFGSSDRKNIGNCCYSYFRLGNALNDIPIDEKILCGLFLTGFANDPMLHFFRPDWNEQLANTYLDLQTRIDFLRRFYPSFDIVSIFKWLELLSTSIVRQPFIESHLQQPDLFTRIRPGHCENVIHKLSTLQLPGLNSSQTKIEIHQTPNSISRPHTPNSKLLKSPTLSFAPGFDVDKHFLIDKELVIQDLNSQRIAEFLTAIDEPVNQVWDCCAGSGGKSILAVDHLPGIQLTVSDIRESILENLKKRFYAAGIMKYKSFTSDLTKNKASLPATEFDLIIADVPCSGSGTWSRTPEQLIHFRNDKIAQYVQIQKAIVSNALKRLRPGGWLLYITCSVFAMENETMIDFLVQHHPVQVIQQDLLKGYDIRADSLFAALLRKKS